MAWISVDQKMVGGKLRKLYKAIGCSQNEAIGILIVLWLWGIDNADADGLIVSADKEDIADVLRPGLAPGLNADVVVDSLIDNGWIDVEEEQLYLHDWYEWRSYYNRYVEGKKKQAERTRKCRERKESNDSNVTGNVTSNVTETSPEQPPENPPAEPPKEPEKKKKSAGYTTDFEEFWAAYPRKVDKGMAYKKYQTRVKDGFSPEQLLEAAKAYARECVNRKTEQQYIKHAKTFLGDATPFVDYIPKNTVPAEAAPAETGANPFRRQ